MFLWGGGWRLFNIKPYSKMATISNIYSKLTDKTTFEIRIRTTEGSDL